MMLAKKPGLRYVVRPDPSAYDASEFTLTKDGAIHPLDLSSIVPKTAKLVHLRMRYANTATGKHVKLFKHGETNLFSIMDSSIIVVNLAHETTGIVECAGQQIDYKCDNVAWTAIGIVVMGWFL